MSQTPHSDEDFFRAQLPQEVEAWQREGVVAQAVARRILAHYGLAASEIAEERRLNRLILVLSVVGGLLVGVGVILFVASNWQEMPRLTKVALLTAVLVVVWGLAYWTRYVRPGPRMAAGLVLLGALIYGAAIFLIGQAYHVPTDEPYLLLLWAVGVLPMGYIVVSRPTLALSILTTLGWYGMLIARWEVESQGHIIVAYLAWSVALLGGGEVYRASRASRPYAMPFLLVGLIGVFAVLFPLTFFGLWEEITRSGARGALESDLPAAFIQSVWLLGAVAVVMTVAGAWLWRRSRASLLEAGGALLAFAVVVLALWTQPFTSPAPYAVLFNGLAAGGVLWALLVGLWTQRESFVNVGLAFLGILVLARYFDFSFDLFDRSLVFIGAGLLLMGGAFALERVRRVLLVRAQRYSGEGEAGL